jgi:N-acetylmuramoyl-L-alanine amidase CwlA
LCKEAGIEGYKTNHSLRATACSLALSKGVPEKLIMDRTGHKSLTSLHTYQRVSAKDKESVSDVLQGGKDCFMDEPITKRAKVDKSAKEGKPCNINLTNCSVLFKM